MYNHPNEDVSRALLALDSAICSWERSTGIESVLIFREKGGFTHRSVNGKPGVPDEVVDEQVVAMVLRQSKKREKEK